MSRSGQLPSFFDAPAVFDAIAECDLGFLENRVKDGARVKERQQTAAPAAPSCPPAGNWGQNVGSRSLSDRLRHLLEPLSG
jgi:hypothetical protein